MYQIKYKSNSELKNSRLDLLLKVIVNKKDWIIKRHFLLLLKWLVRAVIALFQMHHWPLFQMEFYNVFLQGDLEEEVYMQFPPGFWESRVQSPQIPLWS